MSGQHSIDTILQEALEVTDPRARAAYLEEACSGDPAMRKEIESLLDAYLAADTFMNTRSGSIWEDVLRGSDAGFLPTPEELAADFPELEVVEMIGRGGMGAVFKARQASLDRFVALKVLPGDWNTSGGFSERFEREAKILAGLNHPGIVTIHEFGERNGRFFFTMEFVDGTDLGRMIDSGEVPPEMALKLIPQICDAIQFAHDRGVVHRDIKPGNILVDRGGRVKVADFGIAKLGAGPAGEGGGHDSTADEGLTTPHGVVGTPRYMAPEQAKAFTTVDHRADLYALGVVFYEMLVGTTPDKDSLSIPPSRGGKIDRRWDRIVMRALADDPERRYQNASEIRTAVESVLAENRRGIPNWLKAVAVLTALIAVIVIWPKTEPGPEGPLVNSLGMQFVPVEGVSGRVSVWETRVRDYQSFVEETGRRWNPPPFEQTPEHPAVNVSWHDAQAFCQWLTKREHATGTLPQDEVYRLPTDLEWSFMARLTDEQGADPRERHLGQQSVYPWGEDSPVPDRAGNYPDATGRKHLGAAAVPDYEDGFAATAPVGRFAATSAGLHDLGGNVFEWTATFFAPDDARPVLRGGSWWASEADDGWKSLLASYRRADVEATESEEWDIGFRVVRGPRPTETDGPDLSRLVLAGDLEGFEQAIGAEVDVNAPDQAGTPLIVLAADAGNLQMVQRLHRNGAHLYKSDRRGRTALHAAAESGHAEMVDWLLAEGADPRIRTLAREQPLLLAMHRAPTRVLDALLAKTGPESLTLQDTNGNSALTVASSSGPDETVHWVIRHLSKEQIAGVDAGELRNWLTTLMKRDSALLRDFLLKATDQLTLETTLTPLISAIQYDKEEAFDIVVNAIGEDALKPGLAPMVGRDAAGFGRPWAVKKMISLGWDLKDLDLGNGSGLLHATVTPKKLQKEEIIALMEKEGFSMDDQWHRRLLDRELASMPPPAIRETLKILVGHGLDIEARDDKGQTPLIHACMFDNLDAVQALVELDADIETRDAAGFTPLLCAVEKGSLEIVQELVRRRADLGATTQQGRGALHAASPDPDVIRFLLDRKQPLEERDDRGRTPLMTWAELGHPEIVGMLLEAGSDPAATSGAKGLKGTTALHLACRAFDPEVLAEAGERRAALGGPKFHPRPLGSREERLRCIKLLLKHHPDPVGGALAKEGDWMTPLHLAARYGLPEAVGMFLEAGAPPNILTVQLNTPLHLAAKGGHLDCARVLVENGAVLDSAAWLTPLLSDAIIGGNADLVCYFIEVKAPLDRRNAETSASVIHQAANDGTVRMLGALIDAGLDINSRDNIGGTPLHRAAAHGKRDVVDLLFERDARFDVTDSYGMTPADYARKSGHHALARTLANRSGQARIQRMGRKLQPKP